MTDAQRIEIFCLVCGFRVSKSTFDCMKLNACPQCHDPNVPASTADNVTITLTYHELRCLVMWAERWSRQQTGSKTLSKVVYGIADRLMMQCPGKGPLTLSQEFSDLREAFGGDITVKGRGFEDESSEQERKS